MRTPHPRRQLLCVTVLAVASLGALFVARPPVHGSVWAHGDDLALLTAWVIAMAASAWLALATGACVVALGLSRPRLARRLAPALPFGVRRLVEIAIVASCVALPALPAHAAGPATAPTTITTTRVVDQPVLRAAAPPRTIVAAPAPALAPVAVPSAPQHVVVRAGDNLWLIARAALARDPGSRPGENDVARYWRAVIAANRSTLRSGDPSLIFPGEIVTLPPPAAVS